MVDDEAITWICIAVELPFVVFHVSALVCVLRCIRRREANFRSFFFIYYSLQSFADLGNYFLTFLTFRFARIGYVPKWVVEYPLGNLLVFLCRYCTYLQFVVHTFIAVNRYRAIAYPINAKPAKPWVQKIVYVVLFLAPLPGAATRLLGKHIAKPAPDNPNIYVVVYDQAWVTLAGSIAFTIYSVLTAVVSIGFELRTIVVYHRLDASVRRSKHDEFRLVVYALTQFVAQFLQAAYQILQGVTSMAGLNDVRKASQLSYPYINNLFCLSGPISVLVTSSMFRQRLLRFVGARSDSTQVSPSNTSPPSDQRR